MPPSGNEKSRSYDLVVFDVDGTINTEKSCWRRFHEAFGTYEPEGRELLSYHLEHRTPYDEFARRNLIMWRGRHRDEFLDVIRSTPLRDGAVEVLNYVDDRGYRTGAISSGFTFWRERLRDEFRIEFDFYRSNEIVFDDSGVCTGDIIMNTTDNVPGKDKASIIAREARKLGISLKNTVMVGDGWGDVSAMKLAGRSFCVGDVFPEVREAADECFGESLLPLMDRL
jgi:phosphoserine phosphatase